MSNQRTFGLILYFVRQHPGRSALLVVLLCLSGLAEGIGVVSLLPLLDLALATDISPQPSGLTAAVHTALAAIGLEPRLGVLLTMIVLGMTLKAGLYLLAMKQVGYTVARVTTELRLEFIRVMLQSRWSYFVGQPIGRLTNAISSEAARAAGAYRSATAMMAGAIQALVYAGLAFLISWRIAVMAVLGGVLVVLLLRRLISLSRTAGASQTVLMKSLLARLTDALQGIKPIKAMGQEVSVRPLLEAETRGLNEAQERQVLASETLKAAQEPILVVLLSIALFFAISYGDLAFSTVLVIAFLFYRLAGRISLLQLEYQNIALGESAFWSMRESIDEAVREQESYCGKRVTPTLRDAIILDAITFAYGDTLLFEDLSLTIPAGHFVTLVGPSGAGKTTIADLVAGLHRPSSGEVLVDNVPLSEIDLHAWRGRIGYVPQEMFLFHDTVRNNITLGVEIDNEDIEWALRAAGAWHFVQELPHGVDTNMGERGSRLSGGQRQRIAFARALARRPDLLILDEVTTSLDPQTEAAICEVLRSLKGQVTILSISHQSAMIETADVVYRLESGRLICMSDPLAIATSVLA